MRDAGLYLVYIGLESGTEGGLDTLARGITVEQNLAAVALVKELRLMLEFGFMMFDPSSTFESVRANVNFLRRIVGDGSAAAGALQERAADFLQRLQHRRDDFVLRNQSALLETLQLAV